MTKNTSLLSEDVTTPGVTAHDEMSTTASDEVRDETDEKCEKTANDGTSDCESLPATCDDMMDDA